MTVTLGSGAFTYVAAADWGELPEGWLLDDVTDVAVDSADRVYVFSRSEHPIIVFDRAGRFLRSWGEGLFRRPHGLHIAPDDVIYCTDDGDHTVRRCTLDGKVLLELGIPGKPAPFMSGEPFHRCTHTALSPKNEIYVADGYGNARIHKFSPDGKRLLSWGQPGLGPGEFNVPHNLCCDPDGWVYVADRENHRVQVFSGDGEYETEWHNLHRPCGLFMPYARKANCYITHLGSHLAINRQWPNIGPHLSVVANDGKVLARLGNLSARVGHGYFAVPHGLALDSRDDIYVAELFRTGWSLTFPDEPMPKGLKALQKLVRVQAASSAV